MKSVFFVFVILSIVLLSGCSDNPTHGCSAAGDALKSRAIREKNPEICMQIELGLCRDRCYNLAGHNARAPKYCDRIGTQDVRDNCFLNLGAELKDPSLCDNVGDPEQQDKCLELASDGVEPDKTTASPNGTKSEPMVEKDEKNEGGMTITFIKGETTLSRNKGSTWTPIDEEKPRGVGVYDEIKTGENTRAIIRYPDGSFFKLKSNTHVIILPDGVQIKVGITYFNLEKQGKEFKIVTPAYGSVLGTELTVTRIPGGSTTMKLITGKLQTEIAETGEINILSPGEMITVQQDNTYEIKGFNLQEEIKKIEDENKEDEEILSGKKESICFCIPALPIILALLGAGITKTLP